ncbi:calreticulin-like [Tropilaelaps mercedesae]|uniref:Calreticulin n=1 Tax=Tropilaelaps mercedesae TaxID=418985 RepID=A0A1V9XHQ6_9ACAR|nr:calreticulin-like [Tropilaelaps mercedesae]
MSRSSLVVGVLAAVAVAVADGVVYFREEFANCEYNERAGLSVFTPKNGVAEPATSSHDAVTATVTSGLRPGLVLGPVSSSGRVEMLDPSIRTRGRFSTFNVSASGRCPSLCFAHKPVLYAGLGSSCQYKFTRFDTPSERFSCRSDRRAGALDRWVMSAHKGDQQGKFELSYGKWAGDVQKDIGLRTTEDARFYGASARIEPAFSNKDKTLVVQFSVKHEQNIDCGGGYIKLFDCSLDQANMHGDSPYLIMFGPDICGPGTKKVHAIITYRGKNHLINKEIKCKDDIYTHLYTFILRPDQTYEIRIDNEKVESGELEKDWEFLPSPKIKDPEAKKPEDWDDREEIDDPADTKPDDWDLPEFISDPEAKRPEDWDEEMDGEWEPPQIANPDFKGEWKPKKIENPDFQGVWVHPMIDNPLYEPDNEIYAMKEICHVGVDVWQVKSGSIFDNILITDDPDFAREFGEETWGLTKAEEKRAKEQYDEEERVKKDEAAVKERNESEKKNQDASDDEDEPDHDEL